MWNYRVIEFVDPEDDEPWCAIHEVYYDEDGRPNGYSWEPAAVVSFDDGGESRDLAWVLDRMKDATRKPVLREVDFVRKEPSRD